MNWRVARIAAALAIGAGVALFFRGSTRERSVVRAAPNEGWAIQATTKPTLPEELRTEPLALDAKPKPPVQTDPKSPEYDPVKLLVVDVPGRRIFAAEPRDPVWATRREATLRRLFKEDIQKVVKDGKVTSVECRTASCEVKVESNEGKEKLNHMMWALQVRELGALSFDQESDRVEGSHVELSMITMFDHEWRDEEKFAGYVAKKTAEVAEIAKRFDAGAP